MKPRIETLVDGTRLGWIDRAVIEEHFDVLDYDTIEFEHIETGERILLTEGGRHDHSWALCDDCGLPFEYRGSQALTVRTDSGIEPRMTLGPCIHCGGAGEAITSKTQSGEFTTTATVPGLADVAALQILDGLRAGTLAVTDAVEALRRTDDPAYLRFANWLERRPVAATVAATLLAAIISVAAPVALDEIRGGQDDTAQIVDSILDHYDDRNPVDSRSSRWDKPAPPPAGDIH